MRNAQQMSEALTSELKALIEPLPPEASSNPAYKRLQDLIAEVREMAGPAEVAVAPPPKREESRESVTEPYSAIGPDGFTKPLGISAVVSAPTEHPFAIRRKASAT